MLMERSKQLAAEANDGGGGGGTATATTTAPAAATTATAAKGPQRGSLAGRAPPGRQVVRRSDGSFSSLSVDAASRRAVAAARRSLLVLIHHSILQVITPLPRIQLRPRAFTPPLSR